MGQKLLSFVAGFEAPDAKTIRMTLKEPYGLVLQTLAKPGANVPVHDAEARRRHRPEPADHRLHRLGAFHLQEPGLEGPARRRSTSRTRNTSRAREPASGLAGAQGRQGRPGRVDLDRRHADPGQRADQGRDRLHRGAAARPPAAARRRTRTSSSWRSNPSGRQYAFRFNMLHKPFDNPKIRQAVAYALNSKDLLDASIGDPKWYRECKSLFPCGSPLRIDRRMGRQALRKCRQGEAAPAGGGL